MVSFYLLPSLSWSPDGRWLAFVQKTAEGEPARIVRLSLDTLEKQPLTSPPKRTFGDLLPELSPDGRLLAFVRSGSGEDVAPTTRTSGSNRSKAGPPGGSPRDSTAS